MMFMNGTPMIIAMAVVIILVAGIAYLSLPSLQATTTSNPTVQSTVPQTTAQLQNSTTTTPGTGAFACPLLYYQSSGNVTGYNGFIPYTLTASGTGSVSDYLIANKSSGTLYATEYITNVLNQSGTTTPRQHYSVLTLAGGHGFSTAASGLNVTITPQNFTPTSNAILNLTILISANSTASGKTYWMRIDGPCGRGTTPVLVTVGPAPYNGVLTQPVIPYA